MIRHLVLRSLPLRPCKFLSHRQLLAAAARYNDVQLAASPQFSTQQSQRSKGGVPKSFIERLVDSVKEELEKNKELKENLRKIKEESERLEQSDALRSARAKYQKVEAETVTSSTRLKEKYAQLQKQLQDFVKDAADTQLGKRGSEISEGFVKQAKEAVETLEKSAEYLQQTTTVKLLTEGLKSLKQEIDELTLSRARPYKAPEKLRMRVETENLTARTFEPNTEATGVELHKDSKWYQSWKQFSENNPYVNKIWDLKMKYDESDNPLIRTTRFFTDKVTDLFSGLFTKTELSEVLTEICKIDPSFQKDQFLRECELEIIPNILEAMVRGDLEVLKDWCYEVAYSQLSAPIKRAKELGYQYDSQIMDIDNVDIVMGKIMEQGPVLIITFQTNQIESVRDKTGKVVEGDPNTPLKVHYAWVLCRDREILDPKAAWKLLEMHANVMKQWL